MPKCKRAKSNRFNDAVGGLRQKEKHCDIPHARPALSTKTPTKPEDSDFIKKNFAYDTTQDMNSYEYNMDHKYRGIAIIFNHYKFNEPSLEPRVGTNKDVDALLENLPLLGFERDNIIVENDLSKKQIFDYKNQMRASKSDILKNCDCIAIFILSHGSIGNRIYAHDSDYDLYKLVNQYTASNCKELAGKPKLFFVNPCRGGSTDPGVQLRPQQQSRVSNINSDSIDNTSDQLVYSHPIHADILVSLSSHHNHNSFRNDHGSWYIQDLCETIKQFHEENKLATSDINDLLLYTHFRVSKRVASSNDIQINKKKQIPIFNNALCRKLYFKPKSN